MNSQMSFMNKNNFARQNINKRKSHKMNIGTEKSKL